MEQIYKRPFKKKIYPYLFILPFAILTFMFFVVPAIVSIWMSFTDLNVSMKPQFIGFENYKRIFTDYNLPQVLSNTLIFAFFSLVFVILFSLIISISTQYFMRGKKLAVTHRVLWLIPSLLPAVVYVAFWKFLFDPTDTGFINSSLLNLGMIDEPISWFTKNALIIVIIATVVASVSGDMILLSAAINAIPDDLYKAARVDGASEKSIIMKIILPTLRWPLMYITITNIIGFISSYFFILLLTGGGPMRDSTTLPLYAYQQAFQLKYYGNGSAISMIVVVIALVFTLILIRLFDFNNMIKPPRIDD